METITTIHQRELAPSKLLALTVGGAVLPAQTYMAILPYARNAEELALIIVLMMFLLQVIVVVRIMMLCVRSVVIVLNIEAIMRKVLAVIVTTNILNIIKSL